MTAHGGIVPVPGKHQRPQSFRRLHRDQNLEGGHRFFKIRSTARRWIDWRISQT